MRQDIPHPWRIIGIALVAALGVIFWAINGYYREFIATSEYISALPLPKSEAAYIELDFGEGKRRMFRGLVDGQIYPLEVALSAAAENGKFTYKIKGEDIAELADVSGQWKIYWNGRPVTKPLPELTITGGDKYTFRYEK